MSFRAKLTLSLLVLLGTLAYLIVVDLGVNAGRVHYGVRVGHVDLGGLAQTEAVARLQEKSRELASTPVFFTKEGFECEFIPTELGWDAREFETFVAAFRIGRGESSLRALGTRIKAWFGGVKVAWLTDLNGVAVRQFIDDCEVQASALGYDLRRYRFRQELKRAITTYPRRAFDIPTA